MKLLRQYDHVNQRLENVMMEHQHEVMEILIVMHDVRYHGIIINIYNMDQELRYGVVLQQQVHLHVNQEQKHVIMEHYNEVAITSLTVFSFVRHHEHVVKLKHERHAIHIIDVVAQR